MIELSHVTKTFGGAKRALDELSLTVPQGARGRITTERGWQFENGVRSVALASGEYRLIPAGLKNTHFLSNN